MTDACQVTVYETIHVGIDSDLRAVAYPCGRPVVALALCRRHLRAHRRMCVSAACGCGEAS